MWHGRSIRPTLGIAASGGRSTSGSEVEDIISGAEMGGGSGGESDARWMHEARSGYLVRRVRCIADQNSWACAEI